MEDTLIQESWWKRNWKWVVPVGCGVFFIVGIILAVGGVIWGVTSAISDSQPQQDAMKLVQQNKRVIELLGEPIETNGMTGGSFNSSNGYKTVQLTIPIKGPKGEATIRVEGEGVGDKYTYQIMDVYSDEAEEIIKLLEAPENMD